MNTDIFKHTYIFALIVLSIGCKSENKLSKKLDGKWYGQRQSLGKTYDIALNKVIQNEKDGKLKNEQVNFIFKNGQLLMESRNLENTIIDSAKFNLNSDSTLTAGNYKTRIIKVTDDSLILYSSDEPILKSIRIFTRKK